MARRRLNKKVALMGSTVFLILAMLAVVVILRLTRDPAQFLADGDAAWAVRDYEAARRNYAEALNRTRLPEDKIDLYFKLADVYQATDDWRRVLACWEQIITTDPQNVRARLGRLKYSYIMAESLSEIGQPTSTYWNDVSSQATELLEIAREADLLEKEKTQWELAFDGAERTDWDGGIERIGPFLHFVMGRAALELASMGAGTNPDELLAEAQQDLHEARRGEPGNAEIYRQLGAAFQEEARVARSRGQLDRHEEATARADAILAEAIEAVGDVPGPHIDRLDRKLDEAKMSPLAEAREKMQVLEARYQALAERFPSSAEVLSSLAEFYSLYSAYLHIDVAEAKLDAAIAAAEKSLSLDPTDVRTSRLAAGLYYRRFTLYGDESALQKAIELGEAALELPDCQDVPGPRQYVGQVYRFSLCALLGRFYLETTLLGEHAATADAAVLARAQRVVHEIEQIQGSGENPQVLKWRGMLELARGDRGQAVRNLYAAYEQIEAASGPGDSGDAFLSYTLANIFKDTPEVGAVIEFLGSALNSGIVNARPETVLDYSEALLRIRSSEVALRAVSSFDERFGATDRSRQLRARALLARGYVTEAEEAILQLDPADPNTLKLRLLLLAAKASQLQEAMERNGSPAGSNRQEDAEGQAEAARAMRAELHECRGRQADLTRALLQVDPNGIDGQGLVTLVRILIEQGDAARARAVVDAFLRESPQDADGLFCQELLAEPDPSACPPARCRELRRNAIGSLRDPMVRAAELGAFYEDSDQLDEAIAEWQQVVEATPSADAAVGPAYLRGGRQSVRRRAVGQLFDLACKTENWTLAEDVVAIATADNLDDSEGHLFAGRLAFAKGQHAEALHHLDECLKLRPIFSYGYMFRSNVQAALGDELACVADAQKASSQNPADPLVARTLANALLVRNQKLGDRASVEQRHEARSALERTIRLNPKDTQALLAYAGLIDEADPLKALGIRQTIQITAPSLENAVMLGRLATQIAVRQTDQARKGAFLTIAETAFEQARQMAPNSELMLQSYAEYYRVTDRPEEAAQLLVDSNDDRLLWRHYYRTGRYDEAKALLENLHDDPASRNDALKGLVLVAEATKDRAGVRTYSEELLAREDNPANRLAQIRAYLDVGLVQEAELKLQSFKERYPEEPHLLLMEAFLAKRQGQLERALELTNRHLEKNQQDASSWRLRGEVGLLMGDYDQAILDFRKSRLLDDDPDTTVALVNAYLWAGRHEEAASELRGLLQGPNPPAAARVLLERTYRRLGRIDALEQFYAKTLADLPESIVWLARAGAFAIEQRDYDEAVRLYGKAARLGRSQDSASAESDASYGAVLDGYLHALLLSAGDPEAGAGSWHPERLDRLFEEARKHLDDEWAAIALHRMAQARKMQGDVAEATRLCRQAIDKAWGDGRLGAEVLRRARTLLGAEEVSQYGRQRLADDPDSVAANAMMSSLARMDDDYDLAIRYTDRCVALSASDARRTTEYTLQKADLLTAAYKQTSDKRYLQTAVDVYQSLARKMPTNSNILNNLAYLLAENDERLDEAQQYVERALNAAPDHAAYLDTYAFVLHRKGDHAAAARFMAAAIQQYATAGTPSATAYEHLGEIKEALGDEKSALAAYRQALELSDGARSDMTGRIASAIERLQAGR